MLINGWCHKHSSKEGQDHFLPLWTQTTKKKAMQFVVYREIVKPAIYYYWCSLIAQIFHTITWWISQLLRVTYALYNIWCAVQFSCSVLSNSLRPHGLQQARLPCPSPASGAYSNSCPLSWWCHPTISSSVIPFSSYLQSFPASRSFQMSKFFTWVG